ncbi:hypothetical protein C8R44DRAFT_746716 [Mycena epipterygia]|nr:hypothetical protein C8R44DRAFT_746716 [Mycena epipterygia]
MSKSRSVTPTPNFYAPINIPSTSGLTPSRPPTDDINTTTTTTVASTSGDHPSPSQFTHFHSFVSSQASPDDLIHRRPSPDSPPMAKRMRRQSPEDTSRSQSSDSQSGMADTEEPEAMSPYSETSPPSVAPLKKKRTRTLTTPHQSAVLHALLAQSRFPTTAMREEVGRSIGLSARKVQIWFQNQRQKARRPGSQSDTSQPGPLQYGAFPNVPPSYAAEHHPMPREREGRGIPHAYSGFPPSDHFLGSAGEVPPQLLGPGMPGRSSQRGRPVLHLASHDAPAPYTQDRDLPAPPYSSRSLPGPRTLDENVDANFPFRRTHDDPSRTLPPLIFNQQTSRRLDMHSYSMLAARSAPTTPSHASLTSPSSSPSPTFAHNIPAHTSQSYPSSSSSTLALPPPFTLQPQPQWDSSSSQQRPHSAASWSHSGSHSTRGGSSSPPTSFLKERSDDEGQDGDTPRLGSAQPRVGRYDPVRAMFVAYSPTTSPKSRPGSASIAEPSSTSSSASAAPPS